MKHQISSKQKIPNKKQNSAYGSSDALNARPFAGRYAQMKLLLLTTLFASSIGMANEIHSTEFTDFRYSGSKKIYQFDYKYELIGKTKELDSGVELIELSLDINDHKFVADLSQFEPIINPSLTQLWAHMDCCIFGSSLSISIPYGPLLACHSEYSDEPRKVLRFRVDLTEKTKRVSTDNLCTAQGNTSKERRFGPDEIQLFTQNAWSY